MFCVQSIWYVINFRILLRELALIFYFKFQEKFHTMKTAKMFFRIPTKRLIRVVEYLQHKFHKLSVFGNEKEKEKDPLGFFDNETSGSNFTIDDSIVYEEETDELNLRKRIRYNYVIINNYYIILVLGTKKTGVLGKTPKTPGYWYNTGFFV